MSTSRKQVSVRLTSDQYELFRRRLFHEDQTVQSILVALINAYIMGDVSVTAQGRYHISPPTGYSPVIAIPKGDIEVEVEPDWGINDERPQVGAENHRQHPRMKNEWGTRELGYYLRETSGRRITLQNVRKLLRTLGIEKGDNGRWVFDGPSDERVEPILDAMTNGTYDTMIQRGIEQARKQSEQNQEKEEEIEWAIDKSDTDRRVEHLKRLRSLE